MEATITRHNVKELIKSLGLDVAKTPSDQPEDQMDKQIAQYTNLSFKDRMGGPEGLETLSKIKSALGHLRMADFGSNNAEFEIVAKALSWFVGTGHEDQALDVFLDHCSYVGGDFEPERELKRLRSFDSGYESDRVKPASLFKEAIEKGWKPDSSIPKPTIKNKGFVHLGSLKPQPIDWLVDGLIERNSVGTIFGAPAGGKSFIALDMAFSIAAGRTFHGRDTEQGSVFYIAAEGQNGLIRRMKAWELKRQTSLADANIFLQTAPYPLTESGAVDVLIEHIKQTLKTGVESPELIVLDTLAKSFGGADENATKDMNAFVNAVISLQQTFNCCVLVVHHTGKGDQKSARGNSALKAGVDFEYSVQKNNDLVTLANCKMKDAEPPTPVTFKLETVVIDADGNSSCVLSIASQKEVKDKEPKISGIGKNQSLLAGEILRGASGEEVRIEALRNRSSLKGKRFNEALNGLATRNVISIAESGGLISFNKEVLAQCSQSTKSDLSETLPP